MTTGPDALSPAQVLVVNADPALSRLIGEWLAAEGLELLGAMPAVGAPAPAAIVVDLPCSRLAGVDLIRALAERFPNVPIVALSSSMFAHVAATGAVARELGVDSVIAKPTTREVLMRALQRLRHG